MRCGFPDAPSGAGRISADRAYQTGFRGEGLRESAGGIGYVFGSGPLVVVITGRRYKILMLTSVWRNKALSGYSFQLLSQMSGITTTTSMDDSGLNQKSWW